MNEPTYQLDGGERVVVRPLTATDADALRSAFDHLSPASLRHRFFSPVPRLTAAIAHDLTQVDDGRIVLVAVDPSGAIVGEARAVRRRADPSTAEIAVTVVDDHQHRHLGSTLVRRLGREAARAGIERLAGHVQVDNPAAQGLLATSGATQWLDEPGVIGFELPLGPAGRSAGRVATERPVAVAS
jgi:acetyltransferase